MQQLNIYNSLSVCNSYQSFFFYGNKFSNMYSVFNLNKKKEGTNYICT